MGNGLACRNAQGSALDTGQVNCWSSEKIKGEREIYVVGFELQVAGSRITRIVKGWNHIETVTSY
jgi:hypothetical protein